MSRSYKVNRTNGDVPLQNESTIKVYEGVSAAEDDLSNLEEGQIIGVVSNEAIPQPQNPEDGSVVYWNDSISEYDVTAGPTQNNTVLTAQVDLQGKVTYAWKTGGNGSVSRFATLAEAEAALLIAEGNDGYIPNNGIVVVDELGHNLIGVDA